MKRILSLLVVIAAISISCKDDDNGPLYGSIKVTINSVSNEGGKVGLLDIASGYNMATGTQYWTEDILYTATINQSTATFDEVLPGDYRVVMITNPNIFHAVQVKAGQTAEVTL